MRISDWSSDVCSSDLQPQRAVGVAVEQSRDERVGKGPLDRDGKNGGLGVSHRIELRHCERSEAIQSGLRKHWIAASPPAPRNDEEFERSEDHPSVSAVSVGAMLAGVPTSNHCPMWDRPYSRPAAIPRSHRTILANGTSGALSRNRHK